MPDEPSPLYAAHLAHLDALRHQRRSPNTLRVYSIYVGHYVRFLTIAGIETPGLEYLSAEWVGRYQDYILAGSHGTRDGAAAERSMVRLIKTFSRWLWRRGYYAADPLAHVEAPRLPKLHRVPFTESDIHRLLAAALRGPSPEMERALLLLGLDTGCRIGELCATELRDLDLTAGAILFRHTKNQRARQVFFGVASRADGGPCVVALREWLAVRPPVETPYLFLYADGSPLTPDRARRIYRTLGASADVPHTHPHRLRHTHASELLAELPGAELHLRNRLGHVSADVLADYISISDLSARHVAESASLSKKWNL